MFPPSVNFSAASRKNVAKTCLTHSVTSRSLAQHLRISLQIIAQLLARKRLFRLRFAAG